MKMCVSGAKSFCYFLAGVLYGQTIVFFHRVVSQASLKIGIWYQGPHA